MILTVSPNLYCGRNRIKVHRTGGGGGVGMGTAHGVQRAEFMPGLPEDHSWSPPQAQAAASAADCTYPFSSQQI